jgi:hypothetical protein
LGVKGWCVIFSGIKIMFEFVFAKKIVKDINCISGPGFNNIVVDDDKLIRMLSSAGLA